MKGVRGMGGNRAKETKENGTRENDTETRKKTKQMLIEFKSEQDSLLLNTPYTYLPL